ncbi:LysR family transcriptional regulator [Eubacterium sp. ER2]|uniref:LysR family transcriptional regulator n=1 Tax=Eubacterium sp. ER2 TaxID=1519438 RepID=UPI00051C6F9C|nr:LysR family transcriptional regulator [Eubacterium sp. ER2]
MQIQQMRYVLAAAEKKSFSAAAKALFLSQPSLSQQILHLEKELGVPLFVRHSKSVTLTEAGEQFVSSARRILNEVDQLSENMKKYSVLEAGTLRVGMLWIAGYLRLPRVITDYHRLFPGIRYQLHVEGSNTLLAMLDSRQINAAFVIGSDTLSAREEYDCHKLMDDYYVAVMYREHPLAGRPLLSISDLDGKDILMPAKESSFRRDIEQVFSDHHIAPNVICETSQSDIVMQLASQNLAVGFSSRSIAEKLLMPECCIVPLEVRLSRPIYYVTLRELMDVPAVRSFTEFVRTYHF